MPQNHTDKGMDMIEPLTEEEVRVLKMYSTEEFRPAPEGMDEAITAILLSTFRNGFLLIDTAIRPHNDPAGFLLTRSGYYAKKAWEQGYRGE